MAKILVVDDEEDICEVLAEYLEDEGHQVESITDSTKAWELIQQNGYQLVVTDMVMPEMNGIELTMRIVDNFPNTKVLALSGGGDSKSKMVANLGLNQALEMGAISAVLKPISKEDFLKEVEKLLS